MKELLQLYLEQDKAFGYMERLQISNYGIRLNNILYDAAKGWELLRVANAKAKR
jgi:hypothetical protein